MMEQFALGQAQSLLSLSCICVSSGIKIVHEKGATWLNRATLIRGIHISDIFDIGGQDFACEVLFAPYDVQSR